MRYRSILTYQDRVGLSSQSLRNRTSFQYLQLSKNAFAATHICALSHFLNFERNLNLLGNNTRT
jgi:hypothetical protein